jgi:hypothetical protein
MWWELKVIFWILAVEIAVGVKLTLILMSGFHAGDGDYLPDFMVDFGRWHRRC